jgi:hypothetical protein
MTTLQGKKRIQLPSRSYEDFRYGKRGLTEQHLGNAMTTAFSAGYPVSCRLRLFQASLFLQSMMILR